MEGGFFLIQRVDLGHQNGQRITGIEVIGHERPFGAKPSEGIKSRFYSNTGDTIYYVYELEGGTLTIWTGERGLRRITRARLAPTATPSAARGAIRGRRLRGDFHQGRVIDTPTAVRRFDAAPGSWLPATATGRAAREEGMDRHQQLDLEAAMAIIDSNLYMTLGTADENGPPWVSPLYYAPLL